MSRYYLDKPISVTGSLIKGGYAIDEKGRKLLDRGFTIDDEAGTIEWVEPIPGGETYIFPISECRFADGTPILPGDGELNGVLEEEHLSRYRRNQDGTA